MSSELALRDGPIEYRRVEGDPELAPVVFLHEGLGCVATWGRFPDDVGRASGRTVVAFSRHGYGGSGPARLPRSVHYLHDEASGPLPQLLDCLGLEAPVLVGHSDGASIALIHAASRPVSGLVLLAPHVFVEPETLAGLRAAVARYRRGDLAGRLAQFHADPAATFRGWSEVWLRPEFREWNIEALLPRIDCPVLVIQGEDDQYGTARQLDAVEAGVAGPVRRLDLAECGHAPHTEQPARTLQALVGFLGVDESVSGARA